MKLYNEVTGIRKSHHKLSFRILLNAFRQGRETTKVGILTIRQRSFGKVMFSQMSICSWGDRLSLVPSPFLVLRPFCGGRVSLVSCYFWGVIPYPLQAYSTPPHEGTWDQGYPIPLPRNHKSGRSHTITMVAFTPARCKAAKIHQIEHTPHCQLSFRIFTNTFNKKLTVCASQIATRCQLQRGVSLSEQV